MQEQPIEPSKHMQVYIIKKIIDSNVKLFKMGTRRQVRTYKNLPFLALLAYSNVSKKKFS